MTTQQSNVNGVGMTTPHEDDEVNEPPTRWARPSPRILRRQATRITIIEVPTEIHSDGDDEKAGERNIGTGTSTMSKLCRRLRCRCRLMDNFDIFKLDYIQRKFLMQGVLVRAVLMAHAFFIFYAATVTVHSGIYAAVCLLYFVCSVTEGIVMYKLRGFSQKKWICTSTLLYTVCVVPSIWSLHIMLLKERERHSEDYDECVRTFDSCWGGFGGDLNITMLSANKRAFAANSYADFALTTSVCQYTMVFALIFCRWLLPRDNFTREKVAQLLLVLVGSGEDIVEFIGVVFTIGHFGCSRAITGNVLLLWSLSIFQFSLAIPERSVTRVQDKPSNALLNVWVDAVNQLLIKRRQTVGDVSLYVAKDPASRAVSGKKRMADKLRSKLPSRRATVTVQNVPVRRYDWVRSNEFREAIISITVQDGPFLIFRLVVIAILGNVAISIVFYALKNLTVIAVQIYRMYAMLVEFNIRRRSSLLPVRIEEDSDVETVNAQDDDKSEAASDVVCDKAFAYTVPQSLTGSRAHLPGTSTPDLTAVKSASNDQDNNNTPLVLTSENVLDLRTRRQSKANDNA